MLGVRRKGPSGPQGDRSLSERTSNFPAPGRGGDEGGRGARTRRGAVRTDTPFGGGSQGCGAAAPTAPRAPRPAAPGNAAPPRRSRSSEVPGERAGRAESARGGGSRSRGLTTGFALCSATDSCSRARGGGAEPGDLPEWLRPGRRRRSGRDPGSHARGVAPRLARPGARRKRLRRIAVQDRRNVGASGGPAKGKRNPRAGLVTG